MCRGFSSSPMNRRRGEKKEEEGSMSVLSCFGNGRILSIRDTLYFRSLSQIISPHVYHAVFSFNSFWGRSELKHENNDQHKERTPWHWITCDELCLSSKVVHETSISSSIFKRERCFFQKQNREHDHANVLSDIFEKEQEEKEKCLHSRQSIVRVE